MGKIEEEEEEANLKSQLVTDICFIASRFTSCPHRRRHPRKPAFIDWYLLLRIKEDAGIDAIRKQYRQLALQLHPDKNRHPKAEVAFKLISEAYACLSDKVKRKAFNCERQNSFCNECDARFQSENHNPANFPNTEKLKQCYSAERARSNRVLQTLKLRERLKEEAKVIENCLRAHEASKKEFPLFDPSDYLFFPNYPHHRSQIFINPNKDFRGVPHTGNIRMHDYKRGKCESPVYEIRSGNRSARTRPTTCRS
ncbi:uncharacterized protein LOC131224797 [Magnolia sinica]|uniref:uncharacterized protein LOC131224797 n=1 Tax=Magnolia sinica TaxID=86752 RepID=UPI00265A132A|nr:uncharacterized protein LOC131224797 [Magnolia sinica]